MLSSTPPTVSPKSLRACSRTTVVRKEDWSCDTTGLVASRGRHLIIRSAITRSPHSEDGPTRHTGCTGWNSSCSRQILRLIFCFCAVDNGPHRWWFGLIRLADNKQHLMPVYLSNHLMIKCSSTASARSSALISHRTGSSRGVVRGTSQHTGIAEHHFRPRRAGPPASYSARRLAGESAVAHGIFMQHIADR